MTSKITGLSARLRGLAITAACCALVAVGCKEEEAKTPDDANARTAPPAKTSDGSKGDDSQSSVKIDDKIIKACGDMPSAPFSFDSAEVSPEAANVLDAVARCFISGPLKGKGMKLIGHADPRGETEYNLGLGQKRAGSIQSFLAKKGLENSRMATSSKGEFEATGTDESGWAKDRRVEIVLAE
ncbi:MAG: OmpA family protein [Polyangiaceae bacterium]|nr:OmpA family protein [Polyangiaceae bacterium]